jgi:hypothetical protein
MTSTDESALRTTVHVRKQKGGTWIGWVGTRGSKSHRPLLLSRCEHKHRSRRTAKDCARVQRFWVEQRYDDFRARFLLRVLGRLPKDDEVMRFRKRKRKTA